MTEPLDPTETARWTAWKRAHETVLEAIGEEIRHAAGISVADFSVLSRLVENGSGRMPQHDLGAMLDWKRARLSRQLTRMAERGLLRREPGHGRQQLIAVTPQGESALSAARPAHAQAVRRTLFQLADRPEGDFWQTIGGIAASPQGTA
ncbi:MarR family winged helix-turn-helix transcriptional regulator [Actinacidiphila acididurans]|uniref:MarR family transcriptional regulator n=1 Tax=Actinacidiphila acididurans TaxID=2784346 RepID=A0ABS2U1K6_9ACTN|nr:MarR family transcriptional regulator [Actinacidiphila acididurans]MBM9509232.1 MarR family transcriptional regulator [Actinacidiphila acididurans]